MTWRAALIWCINNPGELVRDKYGQWYQVSLESGTPRLRSDMKVRALSAKSRQKRTGDVDCRCTD